MKKASDLLQSFFLKHGIEEGEKYVSFFRQWETIVGEDIAAHADVYDIRNGALVVRVDHPAWMQMLHMRKDEVLRKVNKRFPDLSVSTLHMQLDPSGSLSTTASAGEVKRERVETEPSTEPANEPAESNADIAGTRLERLLNKLGKEVEERNRNADESL